MSTSVHLWQSCGLSDYPSIAEVAVWHRHKSEPLRTLAWATAETVAASAAAAAEIEKL